jgi:hypothetical protein
VRPDRKRHHLHIDMRQRRDFGNALQRLGQRLRPTNPPPDH